MAVALTAFAGSDIRWIEEVKLYDGRVIELQRRVGLAASAVPAQRRGRIEYHEICYPAMKLRWKSAAAYLPDLFDIVEGKAYVHVPLGACHECGLHGDPEPNALYFVWERGEWKRIRHEEFPRASEWNLLMAFVSAPGHEQDDPRGRLTLEHKAQRSTSLRLEQERLGWKRMNESYDWRDGCRKCGRQQPNAFFADAREIFVSDAKTSCEP